MSSCSDEPEEVTFNVDRLHPSQLGEPSDSFAAISHSNTTTAKDSCADSAKVITVSTLTTLNRSFLLCNFATTEESAAAAPPARMLKIDRMAFAIRRTRNTGPIYFGTIPAHLRDRIPHWRMKE